MSRKDEGSNAEQKEAQNVALLPYVQGVTECVSKILHQAGTKPIFQSSTKIRHTLGSTKDTIDKLNSTSVYEISCECGLVYIGETGCLISARISEHKWYISGSDSILSHQCEHQRECRKQLCFNEACLLVKQFTMRKKIRETIETATQPTGLQSWCPGCQH